MKNNNVGFQTNVYNQKAAFTVLKMGDKEIGIWERQFFFPRIRPYTSTISLWNYSWELKKHTNIEKGCPEILTKKPFHSHMKSFAFCFVPKKLVCIAAELTQAFLVLPYVQLTLSFCKKKEIEKKLSRIV